MAEKSKTGGLRVVRLKLDYLQGIAEKLRDGEMPMATEKKVEGCSPKGLEAHGESTEMEKDQKNYDKMSDEWESLWDDKRDCLDDSLLPELTSKLKIDDSVIKLPKNDFSDAHNLEESFAEYGHVIEIYDFKPDSKTEDIQLAFSQYRSEGLNIKWVDDTHCLLIFPTASMAEQALASPIAFMKARPLCVASEIAKVKVKANRCDFTVAMKRPEKTAAVARRLVSGSLGIQVKVSKEVREKERQILKEAKEKKVEKKRLQAEAWGN